MASAWNFKPLDMPPISISCPPPEPWPSFEYSERFYDLDKMLLSQLAYAYSHYLLGDDGVPCVRADYGVGIVASGFGSEIIVRRGLDQMPWVKEPIVKSDPPDVAELRDPDVYDGLMGKVLEAEEYFAEKLEGTGVQIYLCDTQSPLDTAYLLRGTKLLKDFYLHPEFAEELLRRVAEVYVEFSIIQKKLIGEPLDRGVHGSPNVWMARGGVRICEDVAVMLPPNLYSRFCKPVNELCLKPFDGGMDHFCCSPSSDGRQVIGEMLSNPYVRAFNFGSPSRFYDFEETLKLFRSRRVCLIWTDGPKPGELVEKWVKEVAESTRKLGDNTGVIFSISVESFEKARKILDTWNAEFSGKRS
jgi:hypothetical protein